MMTESTLRKAQITLLKGKTWRYLRYLHFRDYLGRVSEEIETVCIAGGGHGFAELACAIEFPHITFTLTDIVGHGYPNYHNAMSLAWQWGLDNLRFSVWNVLNPTDRRFDLVASTEMLEHVPDVPRAVRNMRATANRYVYCLAPFADDLTNSNPSKRQHAWKNHEHLVYGFDQKSFESLFGKGIAISGAYWSDAGLPFRQKLSSMDNDEIAASFAQLTEEASRDLRDGVPQTIKEAAGIKILARADEEVPAVPVLPPPMAILNSAG